MSRRRRSDTEPEPLPPTPSIPCSICRRPKLKPYVVADPGECCARLPTDRFRPFSYGGLECEHVALQNQHHALQERETALLLARERDVAEAIARLIEGTQLTGLDKGMKQFIVRMIKRGAYKEKQGS